MRQSTGTTGSLWSRSFWRAACYVAPRRLLYLRFHSGDDYRYFTFPAEQYEEFLASESQGRYFLAYIRPRRRRPRSWAMRCAANQFPYQRLPRR